MSKFTINVEILLFIEDTLKELVSTFIPQKELKYLPPNYLTVNNISVFWDYIFAIEKYLNAHVLPICYLPLYSSKMINMLQDDHLKKNVKRILKYFETGDKKINDKSTNILPKSAFHYFRDEFKGKKSRYVIDYVCDSHGIRHAYLMSPVEDRLLFYALVNDNILLLDIGTHKDIYENNNLRILINEFPAFLEPLGIYELKGIDPGVEQDGMQTKQMWEKNISLLPTIDGKVYTSSLMSFAGINFNIQNIFNDILFIIENASIKIIKSLGEKYNLFVIRSKSKKTLKYGRIYIRDRISQKEWCINIPYFAKIRLIEKIKDVR